MSGCVSICGGVRRVRDDWIDVCVCKYMWVRYGAGVEKGWAVTIMMSFVCICRGVYVCVCVY